MVSSGELEPHRPEEYSAVTYEQIVEDVSYYREKVREEDRIPFLQARLNEEVDELLRPEDLERSDLLPEKVALLWGFELPEPQRGEYLKTKMVSELGDCMFFLVAAAKEKGLTLHDIMSDVFDRFGAGQPQAEVKLGDIDNLVSDRLDESLPPNYKPDYLMMQAYNIHPIYDPTYSREEPGPLKVSSDGYYSLHFVFNFLSNFMSLGPEGFREKAADALAVVSCIAQTRLDSSLEEIMRINTEKLQRRQQNNTLQSGSDTDRDRVSEAERPDYTAWENTVALLICAPMPDDN